MFSWLDVNGNLQAYMWDLDIQSTYYWGGSAKSSRQLGACDCYDDEHVIYELFNNAIPVILSGVPSYPLFKVPGNTSSPRVDSPGYEYALTAGDIGNAGFANVCFHTPPLPLSLSPS